MTGCKVPSSYALLTFQNGTSLANTPSTQLFIPKAELADLMWSVPPPSLEEASAMYDSTRIAHPAALPAAIQEQIKAFPSAIVHTLPASALFPKIAAEHTTAFLAGNVRVTEDHLLSAVHRARLIKDAEEIALIRRANEISSRAHETVMRVLGQGVRGQITRGKGAGTERPLLPSEWLIQKENEAEALFVASCRREGYVSVCYCGLDCFEYVGFADALAGRSTRRTCRSSRHRRARRRCTTAATTASSRGVPLARTITATRTTSRMTTSGCSTRRCC